MGCWLRLAALVACLVVVPAANAQARGYLDVRLFAHVPAPGQPEGIAVAADGTVYVGTSPKDLLGLDGRPPSKLFAFNPDGSPAHSWVIQGQDRNFQLYGLYGVTLDGADRVYAVDNVPPRIIRINPRTGEQTTYAEFRDVPPCGAGRTTDCSKTMADMKPFPNFPVFAADGTMYVTDNAQALIWRIPPGGGRPEVWFTDPGLETIFGPNGMELEAGGKTLMFALTTQNRPGQTPERPAGLYRLPIGQDGSVGPLSLFWRGGFNDAPDGFALAASGNVYVADSNPFAGGLVVISPQGREVARTPANLLANQQLAVPFDQPANVAFLGHSVLVTNHAFLSHNSQHYAVLDVFTGETGLPLLRPFAPSGDPAPRIALRGLPGKRCVHKRFAVRISVGGASLRTVRVYRDGRLLKRSTHRRFRVNVDAGSLPPGRHTLRIDATALNGRHTIRRARFRVCG
jgi:sugar lactone lactonase YvrE